MHCSIFLQPLIPRSKRSRKVVVETTGKQHRPERVQSRHHPKGWTPLHPEHFCNQTVLRYLLNYKRTIDHRCSCWCRKNMKKSSTNTCMHECIGDGVHSRIPCVVGSKLPPQTPAKLFPMKRRWPACLTTVLSPIGSHTFDYATANLHHVYNQSYRYMVFGLRAKHQEFHNNASWFGLLAYLVWLVRHSQSYHPVRLLQNTSVSLIEKASHDPGHPSNVYVADVFVEGLPGIRLHWWNEKV